jgi:sugar phosphate isomerase/epimerase
MISRRHFGRIAVAGFPALKVAAAVDSSYRGVRLGAATSSFRDFPRTPGQDNVDAVIAGLKACGAGEAELFSSNMEPAGQPLLPLPPPPYGMPREPGPADTERQEAQDRANREDLRKWRLDTPAAHFEGVRRKFDGAGIRLVAVAFDYGEFADDEIDATFRQAKALGAEAITASATIAMAQRLAAFAGRHQMKVALLGHSQVNGPDQLAGPESFAKALAFSTWFRIALDIGHFTAANGDAVAFIRERHERIAHLHVTDRKKNGGANESFGEGDTPINEALQLLQREKYPIPALVEYEYTGLRTSQDEVKRCLDYMRSALG